MHSSINLNSNISGRGCSDPFWAQAGAVCEKDPMGELRLAAAGGRYRRANLYKDCSGEKLAPRLSYSDRRER
jgi:hypothetical protein